MQKKAVVAGHICIDITPVFPGKKVTGMDTILQPGKLVHMDGVDIHTGGCVANTGLAMKILGNDVSLMGKVGNDSFGNVILEILKKYDADKEMIISDDSATSYSVVLAMPGIDRIFLHDPGANDTFTKEDLDYDKIREAALFHFGYPTIMHNMYMDEGLQMAEMFERIKNGKTAISLDMSAIDPNSEAGATDWGKILSRILPFVDFFVPSVEELCFMLDRERFAEWDKRSGGGDMTEVLTVEDIAPLAQKVLAMGAKAVLIKCGAPGMYYKTTDAESMKELCCELGLTLEEWADKEGFERSYKPESVVCGTGAGDTSIAAFLTSILNGESLTTSLQMATATGACCVEAFDALSGLKPLKELKDKISAGWQKNGE